MSKNDRLKRLEKAFEPEKDKGLLVLMQDENDRTRFYSGGKWNEPRVYWSEVEIKAAEPEYAMIVRIVDQDEGEPI